MTGCQQESLLPRKLPRAGLHGPRQGHACCAHRHPASPSGKSHSQVFPWGRNLASSLPSPPGDQESKSKAGRCAQPRSSRNSELCPCCSRLLLHAISTGVEKKKGWPASFDSLVSCGQSCKHLACYSWSTSNSHSGLFASCKQSVVQVFPVLGKRDSVLSIQEPQEDGNEELLDDT